MNRFTRKIILLFWIILLSLDVLGQMVYITNSGSKYHRSTCRYLKKSKIEIVLKEAIDQGYVACKVCSPPQSIESRSELKQENKPEHKGKSGTSTQCTAYTKSGSRCKRTTTSSNRKCWQHGGS